MLTDGPLVLAPSVLALAALRSACSSRAGVKLHAYLGQLVASGREAGAGAPHSSPQLTAPSARRGRPASIEGA